MRDCLTIHSSSRSLLLFLAFVSIGFAQDVSLFARFPGPACTSLWQVHLADSPSSAAAADKDWVSPLFVPSWDLALFPGGTGSSGSGESPPIPAGGLASGQLVLVDKFKVPRLVPSPLSSMGLFVSSTGLGGSPC